MDDNSPEWGATDRVLSRRVREVREKRGLSQQELVTALHRIGFDDINTMTVSRIENGTRPVRVVELEALARALDVPESALRSENNLARLNEISARVRDSTQALHDATRDYVDARQALAETADSLPLGEETLSIVVDWLSNPADQEVRAVQTALFPHMLQPYFGGPHDRRAYVLGEQIEKAGQGTAPEFMRLFRMAYGMEPGGDDDA